MCDLDLYRRELAAIPATATPRIKRAIRQFERQLQRACRGLPAERRYQVHNLIAHPLLVICAPVGARLHEYTTPDEGTP